MSPRPLPVWSPRPVTGRAAVSTVALLLGLTLLGCGGSTSSDDDASRAPTAPVTTTSSPQAPPASVPLTGSPAAPSTSPAVRRPLPDAPGVGAATHRLPAMPPEAKARTVAGRDAFVTHVIDLWAHALATNNATPLRALAPERRCSGCAALSRELDARRADGWHVALHGVEVGAITGPKRVVAGRPVTVVATVDIPATFSLNDDGTYRASNPSHDGAGFEVDVVWQRGRFRLLGYALSG